MGPMADPFRRVEKLPLDKVRFKIIKISEQPYIMKPGITSSSTDFEGLGRSMVL